MEDVKKPREWSNLALRTVSGVVYIAVLLIFFLLKIFVWIPTPEQGEGMGLRLGYLLFDVLVLVFTGVGTYEMLRAFKDKMVKSQRIVVMMFALALITFYAVSDFLFADVLGVHLPEKPGGSGILTAAGRNYSMNITFGVFITGMSVLMALLVFSHEKITLESTGYSLLCFIYPSLFLLMLSVCNHLEKYSEIAIMLVFVICPAADTFAYLFGRAFGKKLPAKMAPNISPKKTIIGGFGGLIGGAFGAVLVFFACYGLVKLDELNVIASLGWKLELTSFDLIFFIALGVLTSAFCQFGDLVESAIKRKLAIKDMGNIMPGHGGILDRIDSTLYAALIVSLAMVVRIMFVG